LSHIETDNRFAPGSNDVVSWMMRPLPEIAVAIATFAVAGGWLAAVVTKQFAGSRLRILLSIIACAILALWAYFETGWTIVFAMSLTLAWALFTLSAIDALVFRLPDALTLPLTAIGLLLSWYPFHDLPAHIAGAAIGFAAFALIAWAYEKFRGHEGLGFGDAKLAGAAGAWLGWYGLPSVVIVACVAGFLWVGIKAAARGRSALTERIPFGVALAVGIWIVWLHGPLEFPGA
jgi:leader peptidase (prepilin peptidase) / N-methyltransferase